MNGKHHHEDGDFRKEEKRIRELDRLWGEAASAKNLDAVVAFYAADGSLVWPGTPPTHGTVALRAMWKQMMADIDGLKLEFIPETITFSPDGQLATDYGIVRFEQKDNPYTTTLRVAKYLVVWKKVNDSWKVLYDCYNLNVD
ncbi:YybH family protein [Aestuariivirga sp.]|uniref:YybH family protein n=1 Tax=Aestuariivirga sp. TaxID=2650926 RepID=UPI00391C2DD4